MIQKLKDKNNSLTDKDHLIIELKKTIVLIRRDLFDSDQKRIVNVNKLKEVREIYHNVIKDKEFYLNKI